MPREERFLSLAALHAQDSIMHYRHGSVIVQNGKPISFGNNHPRNYSKDGIITKCGSCHAEVDAIRNAYKLKVVHREQKA